MELYVYMCLLVWYMISIPVIIKMLLLHVDMNAQYTSIHLHVHTCTLACITHIHVHVHVCIIELRCDLSPI